MLLGILLFSTFAFSQTKTKAQVCYGDQGVDIQAPYVLTIKRIQPFQIDLITEDFLNNDTVNVMNVFYFEPAVIFVLSVNPHTSVSDDVLKSIKQIDRNVRRSVSALLKKYEITAAGYALECNGTVTGLPRAGGMN